MIPLHKSSFTIGTDGEYDMLLEHLNCRGFLKLRREGNGYALEAKGIPVCVNGTPIRDMVMLKTRDRIEIGTSYVFLFVSDRDLVTVRRTSDMLKKLTETGEQRPPENLQRKCQTKLQDQLKKPEPITLRTPQGLKMAGRQEAKAPLQPQRLLKNLPVTSRLVPPSSIEESMSGESAAEAEMTLMWKGDEDKDTDTGDSIPACLIAPANGQILSLPEKKIVIGRLPGCDLHLLDEYVSRQHLELVPIAGGGHLLRNVGKNEVIVEKNEPGGGEFKVSQKFLKPGESTFLAGEVIIIIGTQVLYYFFFTRDQAKHFDISPYQRKCKFFTNLAKQKKELLDASQLQKVLTPRKTAFDDIFTSVWFKYFAIDDLSGDFFLSHKKENSLFLCLGDVSGHGPAAALWAGHISGMFKILANERERLSDILECMNVQLTSSKPKEYNLYALVTLVRVTNDRVELAIGGNYVPPLYYCAATGEMRPLNAPSNPVGIMPVGQFKMYTDELEFKEGDMLILFTDGVIEAEMEDGAQVGYKKAQERMESQMKDGVPAEQFLDVFLTWLKDTSEIQDDLSMVLVGRQAGSSNS